MVRKVTLSGGVLDGKSFLVRDSSEALIHHAAHGGRYVLSGALGTWHADAPAALTEPVGLDRALAKAAEGYRVLVVAQRRRDAVAELRALPVDSSWDNVERIVRANGAERITFKSGGFIAPVGLTGSRGSRGIAADVLYLLDVAKDDPALVDVLPSLDTSEHSSIVVHGEA